MSRSTKEAEIVKDAYRADKALFHPDVVAAFKCQRSHELNPTLVHLMPQNACNQNCHFCTYRDGMKKNSINLKTHIPLEKLKELLEDFHVMGVKAVEITGGGEPFAYPHMEYLLNGLRELGVDVGVVTNGTLLTEEYVELLYQTNFKWGRVSIDAGTAATYVKIRRCPRNHFEKAWRAVRMLSEARDRVEGEKPVIGVGFVTTDENFGEPFLCATAAKIAGANSVRVSFAFTDKGSDLLDNQQREIALENAARASNELNDSSFLVSNLLPERLWNISGAAVQDYDYCGSKDLLCVIEGEQKLYTCCTLTGALQGLAGSIEDKRFSELWHDTREWRKEFNVRARCKCPCIYEKRNATFTALRGGKNIQPEGDPPMHVNFI